MNIERRKTLVPLTLAFALCLVVPACSRYRVATTLRGGNLRTYDGPLKPKDSVGFLGCAASNMEIAAIDAVPIKELKARTGQNRNYAYLELLPGEHTVLVKGSTFDTTHRGFHPDLTVDISSYTISMGGESTLTFAVEAGHVYVIKSKIRKNRSEDTSNPPRYVLTVFVEDVRTREIVCLVESDIQK